MITKLHLKNFKSFQDATLELGPFSVLVGTNASGKSNVRDAFRFLHGIGRGYTLAEIIGEKRVEGEKIWGGIRGGLRGLTFQDTETFALHAVLMIPDPDGKRLLREAHYFIEVHPGTATTAPRVVDERLAMDWYGGFRTASTHGLHEIDVVFGSRQSRPMAESLGIELPYDTFELPNRGHVVTLRTNQPMLSQLLELNKASIWQKELQFALDALKNMRFLDPEPELMRQPSTPGQTVLSDRGENLASVLHAIANDPQQKALFIEWLHELTPMDASDFAFPADPAGRILLTLVEASGYKTTAYSASDGTLRFLALLAALLGPQPAQFYFFEELEAGMHPTRLRLLLNLIEQRVGQGDIQIVATSHSPQLLLLVEPDTLESVSLTYRLENQPDTRMKKVLDLPHARHLVATQDVARLHESGWLEDAAAFMDEQETTDSPTTEEHAG